MEIIEVIKKILKTKHLRITKARLAVIEILIHTQEKFVSSEEIFLQIKNRADLQCDQVSVYRTLTLFETLDIVIKSSFQGEAARFQLNVQHLDHTMMLSHSHSTKQSTRGLFPTVHEHFFKCLACCKIEPFKDCLVIKQEQEFLRKGYKNLQHHLEIVGLCPSCAMS